MKFAFFSCQDYTHGYYNALDAMADGDYDFVVCLGDYIYADAAGRRLAKRDGALTVRAMREAGMTAADILEQAQSSGR